jgi:hypothetical protein
VYVVTGKKRDAMVERVCQAQIEVNQHPELAEKYKETFAYYPEKWISPFIDRRRANGWGYMVCSIFSVAKKKKWLRSNYVTSNCSMRLWAYILPSTKRWALVQKWILP